MSVVAPSQSRRSVAKSASNIHPFCVRAAANATADKDGTYSNWYCLGFSPNSLFTDCDVAITLGSLCTANIEIISIQTTNRPVFFITCRDSETIVFYKKQKNYTQNRVANPRKKLTEMHCILFCALLRKCLVCRCLQRCK